MSLLANHIIAKLLMYCRACHEFVWHFSASVMMMWNILPSVCADFLHVKTLCEKIWNQLSFDRVTIKSIFPHFCGLLPIFLLYVELIDLSKLSTVCSTSLPAQHLRPSGLLSCRSQSLELSQISSGTRPSVQTLSDVCLKRTYSLDTSAFSALEVLEDNHAL